MILESETISFASLTLNKFEYHEKITFLQHINASIEISPIFLIDFSSTIGHNAPENSEDLSSNTYLRTINSIQEVLRYYSTNSFYPVFGSGAIFSGFDVPSYYFALTGNIFRPEVPNFQMLFKYYIATLEIIKPTGPCSFTKAIEEIHHLVKFESSEGNQYFSIFILTSQDVSDPDSFQLSLEKFRDLPISINFLLILRERQQFRNIEKIVNYLNKIGNREFLNIENFDYNNSLQKISEQMLQFSNIKGVIIKPDPELIKFVKSTSLTGKKKEMRKKQRTEFFNKYKNEVAEYLKGKGWDNELIEEFHQFGVPFVEENLEKLDFIMAKRKSLKAIKQRNSLLVCAGCNMNISKFVTLNCGCEILCESCSKTMDCPKCNQKD